jgi:hypothetical protein
MAVNKKFLKQDNAASLINLQAAIGLERNGVGSASAQRKKARLQFFGNLGAIEINRHYMDYSSVVSDNVE